MKSLMDALVDQPGIEVGALTKRVAKDGHKKEAIRESIFYLLSRESVVIVKPSKRFDSVQIQLLEKPDLRLSEGEGTDEYPRLAISLPPFNLFGLKTDLEAQRVPYYSMREEFMRLIENAERSIFICSPFLQKEGFNTFLPTLISKAERGVDVKIVSRQIDRGDYNSRYTELKEIYEEFRNKKAPVSIRNYHYQSEKFVKSSTHAKFIVCDNRYAYVGSGEFRLNSFEKNFELGVIIEGETASNLGLIFDMLFSVSSDVRFDGEDFR